MVDVKSFTAPKVAIPIIGIVVLIVVSSLVAVFYIRNPTVTDGIFGVNPDETTTSPLTGDSPSDHITQSPMGNQPGHSMQSTTPGNHEHSNGSATSGSSTSATAATLPATTTPGDSSTPMHAIEPVQHL